MRFSIVYNGIIRFLESGKEKQSGVVLAAFSFEKREPDGKKRRNVGERRESDYAG